MNNQSLEAITVRMIKIEERKPKTYTDDAEWLRLYKLRDNLTIGLVKKELAHQKDKLARLNGKDTTDVEKLIGQYEKYLENHNEGDV